MVETQSEDSELYKMSVCVYDMCLCHQWNLWKNAFNVPQYHNWLLEKTGQVTLLP